MNPFHLFNRFIALVFVLTALFITSAHAAQVRIYESGLTSCHPNCAPDFSILNRTVNYTVVGNTGTFEILYTGFFNNDVTLANDDVHVDDVSTHADAADGFDGYTYWSLGVASARQEISFEIDISAFTSQYNNSEDLTVSSGTVDINGTVLAYGSTSTLRDFTGASLSGDLVTSSIDRIGFNDDDIVGGNTGTSFVVDFLGSLDSGNSLIQNIVATNNSVYGVVSVTNLAGVGGAYDYNSNWWEQSFTGTITANVVVPVPAAAWLFVSSICGLFCLKRRTEN